MKSLVLSQVELAEALSSPVTEMAEFIQRAIEDLPADIAAEVTGQDIALTGGGALLERLDLALARRVGASFKVPETPMHCVIRGSAAVLAELDKRRHLLVGP
jgi:rod shape-determining protein MreB